MPRKRSGGRPTQEQRQAIETAILEAASRAFTERGFDGVSMDEIAKEANTSKQTVYARYPTKAALFAAFMSWRFQRLAEPTLADPEELKLPPEEYLQHLGVILLNNNVGPEGRRAAGLLRTVLEHTPEMAQTFWNNGPGRGRGLLHHYLQTQVDKGVLSIPDMEVAMEQFLGLIVGGAVFRIGQGLPPLHQTYNELQMWAAGCVELFLHFYRSPRL